MKRVLLGVGVAILLLASNASAVETNMRATLDVAYTFTTPDGRHWAVIYGWAVANGWNARKGAYIDGVLVGEGSSVERHDVADIVASWGWQANDGQPRQCDIAATSAPCASCLGLWVEHEISKGKHTLALCVSGRSDSSFTMPLMVCDTRTVVVQ